MIVALNVSTSEPFVMESSQTAQQATDLWYAKNQGDYAATQGASDSALPDTSAAMGIVVENKPGADSLIDNAMLGQSTGLGARPLTPGSIRASTRSRSRRD